MGGRMGKKEGRGFEERGKGEGLKLDGFAPGTPGERVSNGVLRLVADVVPWRRAVSLSRRVSLLLDRKVNGSKVLDDGHAD